MRATWSLHRLDLRLQLVKVSTVNSGVETKFTLRPKNFYVNACHSC